MRLLTRVYRLPETYTWTRKQREWTSSELQTYYATPLTEGSGFPPTGGCLFCANSLSTQLAKRVGVG